MRKKQILFLGAFLGMVLLAGCGQKAASETVVSDAASGAVQDATEQISVTLVNASNVYIKEVIFSVPEDESYEGYAALGEIDGLEPEDTYTASIPVSDQNFQIEAYDDAWDPLYDGTLQGTVDDGSIVVLLPEDNDTQMIYEPGTDVEEARAEASLAYGAKVAATQEYVEQQEDALANQTDAQNDQLQQAAKELGYESVENMRFMTHEGFNRDDAEFWEIVGYWYPDGDANSPTYFAVDNRDNLRWFRFDEKKGDVETGVDTVKTKVLKTYTLYSEKKFTISGDVIRFEDDDTEYCRGTY